MFPKYLPFAFLAILGFLSCKAYRLTEHSPEPTLQTPKSPKSSIDEKRLAIVHYADNFINTPYKYAGKTPKRGFDCSGFTYFVLKKYNVEVSPSSAAQSKQGVKKRISKAEPGDLLFFKKPKSGRIFHVAMIYSNSKDKTEIIHSTSSRGVIIDDLFQSSYWKPKISHVRDVINK